MANKIFKVSEFFYRILDKSTVVGYATKNVKSGLYTVKTQDGFVVGRGVKTLQGVNRVADLYLRQRRSQDTVLSLVDDIDFYLPDVG